MARFSLLSALVAAGAANAYWLMGANNVLTYERLDPIMNPGSVSSHAHLIVGGSGFRDNVKDSAQLRDGLCTSIPIKEDHSNYWVPNMYFEWKNGTVSSLTGGVVIYYLFGNDGKAKAFPENFRMISGDPDLRTYDPNSKAQQAITFLCLDFNGKTTEHNELPNKVCPSGIRSQVNFPMCWDGKNADSADHRSHVAYPSEGADKGTCNDPNFPITLPRIFMEVYWDTGSWNKIASEAKDPSQPFVFSNGDHKGYGYHGDFLMGWDRPTLERAIAPDGCTCDIYGSFDCCVNKGIFTKDTTECRITPTFGEAVMGTLPKLPGINPITRSTAKASSPIGDIPDRYDEVIEYQGKTAPRSANIIPGSGGQAPPASSSPSSTPSFPSDAPPSGAPVPSASASASVAPPAEGEPTPTVLPNPAAPSATEPSGSATPLPGYPDSPAPSGTPAPSNGYVNPPAGSGSPTQSGAPSPTVTRRPHRPPHGSTPRPINNGSAPGNGTCKANKVRRANHQHRRRFTASH